MPYRPEEQQLAIDAAYGQIYLKINRFKGYRVTQDTNVLGLDQQVEEMHALLPDLKPPVCAYDCVQARRRLDAAAKGTRIKGIEFA